VRGECGGEEGVVVGLEGRVGGWVRVGWRGAVVVVVGVGGDESVAVGSVISLRSHGVSNLVSLALEWCRVVGPGVMMVFGSEGVVLGCVGESGGGSVGVECVELTEKVRILGDFGRLHDASLGVAVVVVMVRRDGWWFG
jgi:hypothetical protein